MDHLLKRQQGHSEVSEKYGLQREQAHLFRDGAWGRLIRTEKPGEPGGAPAGGVISRAVSEAGSGSGGQKKKKKKNPCKLEATLAIGTECCCQGKKCCYRENQEQTEVNRTGQDPPTCPASSLPGIVRSSHTGPVVVQDHNQQPWTRH